MHNSEPSEELRLGRRQLTSIREYEMLEDLKWYPKINFWVLRFKLTIELPENRFVPPITNWYVHISPSYPWGKIKVYPDQIGGITHTFLHQDYNKVSDQFPWRQGDICVNTSLIGWGRNEFLEEPFEATSRLVWYIKRCVSWVEAAATNQLAVEGEPFELPPFPKISAYVIVFNEDEKTLQDWTLITSNVGLTKLKKLKVNNAFLAVEEFEISKEKTIKYNWGKEFSLTSSYSYGLWLLLTELPILPPWQMPENWGELFEVGERQGIDLKKIIQDAFLKYQKRQLIEYFLIGFPISENIGEDPSKIHWIAIEAPSIPPIKGFKIGSQGYNAHLLNLLFANKKYINWASTENWNKVEITSRGNVMPEISLKKIVLIGAGAIGALLSEQLVRLGCEHLHIIDDDIVKVGNFSRHTLDLSSVRKFKAECLTNHLNSIFPFVNANFTNTSLQQVVKKDQEFFQTFDIIIDATGSDEVINLLSDHLADSNKILISVSTGILAKRLYCYLHNDPSKVIEHNFRSKIQSWLLKEKTENNNLKLPRDGIGCWHPIFPARLDDLNSLLSTLIKLLEHKLKLAGVSQLIVLEKVIPVDGFSGIRLIEE